MIFRLRDFVFSPVAIWRFHELLMQSQQWAPETRRGWVQERLERTLRHAVKNVPYYKRTLAPYESQFTDMVARLDLSELPVITKETVRNHFAELCAHDSRQYGAVPVRTSGSTGTPTTFLLDRQSNVSHFAFIWRLLNWTGYRFGDRFADLTGHIPKKGRLFEYDLRLNCLHLSSFDFKQANTQLYLDRLRQFNPVVIKAYPSSLDLLCRWTLELGLEPYRPTAVLTCAESLLDHQRTVIEETLGRPLFDFYNQNERAALISSCEKNRYHIHEEYSHVEVTRSGIPESSTAATAEIVATTIHNFAMPSIRYRTDDLARCDDGSVCDCGRTYTCVQQIIGRVEDIVVTPDGRHVGRLDAAFKNAPGIRLSQIVQETVDEIQVNIVKGHSFTSGDRETVERELRARLGDALRIRFRYVDTILPGRNGKLQFVVSKPGREAVGQRHSVGDGARGRSSRNAVRLDSAPTNGRVHESGGPGRSARP